MPTLALTSFRSSGLEPGFAGAARIELATSPLGEGGFGIAYEVLSIDGKAPAVPQVVKVLKDNGAGGAQRGFDTIQALQGRLRAAEQENRQHRRPGLLATYPALLGAPQFSFSGTLNGRPVLGHSSNNLVAQGFEEFGAILGEAGKHSRFVTLPFLSRVEMARQLAEGFDVLNKSFRFLHADFKAEALFIDPRGNRCAIIDFDSGAVACNPTDKPSTFGTLQDWLAPEIFSQLAASNPTRVVKVDALSDAWSVSVALHYILLGCHPMFFFSEISRRSLDAYFKSYRWPDVSPSFTYFEKPLEASYRAYHDFLLKHVPLEVTERFAATINRGYFTPANRTTPGQWAAVLGGLLRPRIRSFTADHTLVDGSRPVRLRWATSGGGALSVSPGPGDVTGLTHADVSLRSDTVFTLSLTAPTGQVMTESVTVEIAKAPPAVSRFSADLPMLLDHHRPARLSWSIAGYAGRVTIDNGVGEVTGSSHVDVLPRCDTTYRIRAENALGATEATVTVRVSRAAPTVTLLADEHYLDSAGPVTLTWSVSSEAHEIELEGHGAVPSKGSLQVAPRKNTTYRLVARTYFGVSSEASVAIAVSAAVPQIDVFSASPSALRAGGSCSLSWAVRGASETRVEPHPGLVPASGSDTLSLSATTNFVLTAISDFGVVARRSIHVPVWSPTTLRGKITPLRAIITPLAGRPQTRAGAVSRGRP